MSLAIIVAIANNNVIGNDNKLIWHLPADLKYFKIITTGKHIIMGRKTFESIGKPLPNRTSVIITRNKEYKAEGCIVVGSLDSAIQVSGDNGIIIGGGEIFKDAMHIADKLYVTKVFADFEGDVFFPEIKDSEWQLVSEEKHLADDKNNYDYSFCIYTKR